MIAEGQKTLEKTQMKPVKFYKLFMTELLIIFAYNLLVYSFYAEVENFVYKYADPYLVIETADRNLRVLKDYVKWWIS